MAAWTLRPTSLELQLNADEALKRIFDDGARHTLLSEEDYYSYNLGTGDDPYGLASNRPIYRNVMENTNRLYVERNIHSQLHSVHQACPLEQNGFDEDHIELERLTTNPACFIFLGKPGVGKSTLAKPLAQRLNSILISPETIIEYYKVKGLPDGIELHNAKDGTMNVQILLVLVLCRIYELDVVHRGYVMDGFPILDAAEVTVEEQLRFIHALPRRPDYVFLLHMQDVDLCNRRRLQKVDPETNLLVSLNCAIMRIFMPVPAQLFYELAYLDNGLYSPYKDTPNNLPNCDGANLLKEVDTNEAAPIPDVEKRDKTKKTLRRKDTIAAADFSYDVGKDGEIKWKAHADYKDLIFQPLDTVVLSRLITRVEDEPSRICSDLRNFHSALPYFQAYLDTYENRKILELNAYQIPVVVFHKIHDFLASLGVMPVPLPIKLVTSTSKPRWSTLLPEEDLGELGEEAPCIPYPSSPGDDDVEWPVIERTCAIMNRVDPRFSWRLTAWGHFCPVALKYGRTMEGKSKFAVGYLDKLYFLSSEDAYKQFELNPRPFLLPTMPSTPIKFYVIGHPLAGKTIFCTELANYLGAYVIDMEREVQRKFHTVKRAHLFRVRLKAVFDAIREVNRENYQEWKELERGRRDELLAFLEYVSNATVNETPDSRSIDEIRADAQTHQMGDTYSGICQKDDGLLPFSYKDFKENWRKKRILTHQKKLEIAWKLFKEGKLRYKSYVQKQRLERLLRKHKQFYDRNADITEGEDGTDEDEDEEEEEFGEGDLVTDGLEKKKPRFRRREFCPPPKTDESKMDEEAELESILSSVLGPDDEPEESIRLRFPLVEIPSELINRHPRPFSVTENEPRVVRLVDAKVAEAAIWADTHPPEIYLDILIRAIGEVEPKYFETNPNGALSGGWIVDNINPNLENFKLLLRHPITAPDNVIVLSDVSEVRSQLLKNLKRAVMVGREKLQKASLSLPTESRICELVPIYGPKLQRNMNDLTLADDDNIASNTVRDIVFAEEFEGEATDEIPGELEAYADFYDRYLRTSLESTEGVVATEEVCRTVVVKTESEMIHDHLPADTLVGQLEEEISGSQHALDIRDRLREISLRDSLKDISQREVLASWLATFGIHIPVTTVTEPTDEPPKVSDLSDESSQPTGKRRPLPFPVPNYAETKDWTPKALHYELLALPQKKLLEEHGLLLHGICSSTSSTVSDSTPLELSTPQYFTEDTGEGSGIDPGEGWNLILPEKLIRSAIGVGAEDTESGSNISVSPQVKFLTQVRQFEEFWSMLIPILNREKILYWKLGVMDEEVVLNRIQELWRELETRWTPKARWINSGDLKAEYECWMEANRIWKFSPDLLLGPSLEEQEGEGEGRYSSDESETGEGDVYDPVLTKLLSKPEEYRLATERIERMRYFGDSYRLCPVTLKKQGLLRKGFPAYATRYMDRIYYFANVEAMEEFLKMPSDYIPKNNQGPLQPPPPRICVTGSLGCGQDEAALEMARKHSVYYINFRQRLQELIKVVTGRNVGPGLFSSRSNAGSQPEKSADGASVKSFESTRSSIPGELPGEGGDFHRKSSHTPGITTLSFGLMNPLKFAHCQQTRLDYLEELSQRDWSKLTALEESIQAFLQYGRQLPDEALEELVSGFWTLEPFKGTGFILVGFPNTAADIRFMVQRNLIPEVVYTVECNPRVMIKRLHRKEMDEWFFRNPGEKKRLLDNLVGRWSRKRTNVPDRALTTSEKERLGAEYIPIDDDSDNEPLARKDQVYKNNSLSATISQDLLSLYRLCTKDLRTLKIEMNQRRIEWKSLQTDSSLTEGKRKLSHLLSDCFLHRQSYYEVTFDLSLEEADVLLRKGFFAHSKFGRMCPVEVLNGNRSVNLWFACGVCKFPILHRGFVYFLAGEENATAFRKDPWKYIQIPYHQSVASPLYLVVLGRPKSGKTEISRRISEKLGLARVSLPGIAHDLVQSFAATESESHVKQSTPMLLANEILAYLRSGVTTPHYMNYRILDFALMDPVAQIHGVVFDDYPVEDQQLQELLERGIVPSVVINLEMNANEGHRRAELVRFNPHYNYVDPIVEPNDLMDSIGNGITELNEHGLQWYAEETQCLFRIDATQNPSSIFSQVKSQCYQSMTKVQHYINSMLRGLPCCIAGITPLSSLILPKLSVFFGAYDPVALNDSNELTLIRDLTKLDRIVEFRGELYIFASYTNVQLFLTDPEAYLPPRCNRLPPEEKPVAVPMTEEQMYLAKSSWGFLDFDPVLYVQGNRSIKWLQHGLPEFAVQYKSRVYFFTTRDTMEIFLKKPEAYCHIPLPLKLPGKTAQRPLDSYDLSPAGYLIVSGLTNEVAKMLDIAARTRPKFPFMSATKSSLLYLGYHLKTLNMKSSLELRTHYRKAMVHMTRTSGAVHDLLQDINDLHGRKVPEDFKKRLDTFLALADLPDDEKVLDPRIPGFGMSGDTGFRGCCSDENKFQADNPLLEMKPAAYLSKSRLT